MAYNATYSSDDISPSVIDALVTIVVTIVPFATIIGLVLLYKWLRRRA